MYSSTRYLLVLTFATALPGLAANPAYPSKPVRMIVPFAPGGSTDVIARLIGQKLSEVWGQQVVIDNRAGAGGNIGMGLAAHANPDGHTMLAVSSSYVVNPTLLLERAVQIHSEALSRSRMQRLRPMFSPRMYRCR